MKIIEQARDLSTGPTGQCTSLDDVRRMVIDGWQVGASLGFETVAVRSLLFEPVLRPGFGAKVRNVFLIAHNRANIQDINCDIDCDVYNECAFGRLQVECLLVFPAKLRYVPWRTKQEELRRRSVLVLPKWVRLQTL